MSKNIPQTVRNSVWLKYIGEYYNGKCFCCNLETISKGNYECGHIVSKKNGGDITLENLRPICSLCNRSMGTQNMIKFMEKYGYTKDTDNSITLKNSLEGSLSPGDRSTRPICWDDLSEQRDDMHKYLYNLTCKQLRQLCMTFRISHYGTKYKLIKKISRSEQTVQTIQTIIRENKNKKNFIVCGDNRESWHLYYTNNVMLKKGIHIGDYYMVKNMCKICGVRRDSKQYRNEFYGTKL